MAALFFFGSSVVEGTLWACTLEFRGAVKTGLEVYGAPYGLDLAHRDS